MTPQGGKGGEIMNIDTRKEIESLIKKAAESTSADDALKFSQAATNVPKIRLTLR